MTSELWNDLTGMDRVHAILSAQLLKRTQSKPRIRRGSHETIEAYTWRKNKLKWGDSSPSQDDTSLTFDPLPPMMAKHL
jgi:hypothetical protein